MVVAYKTGSGETERERAAERGDVVEVGPRRKIQPRVSDGVRRPVTVKKIRKS